MIRLTIITALTIALISTCSVKVHSKMVGSWEQVDTVEYRGSTGQETTVEWSDQPYDSSTGEGWCPLATFQIKIWNRERDIWIWIADNIPRDTFTWTYSFPKTGHWISYIRMRQKCEEPYRDPESENCNNHTETDREDGYEYSDWTASNDPSGSQVDGVPRGWSHFIWIAAPGPLSSMEAAREHLKSYTKEN